MIVYATQQNVASALHVLFVLHEVPSAGANAMLVALALGAVMPLFMAFALRDIHRRPTVRVPDGKCHFWLTQRRGLHHKLDLAGYRY
jgi:hypothetical protein